MQNNQIDPAQLEELARRLRVVRRRAGDPSYRHIARRSYFSVATINRALTGKYFPKLEVVRHVLDVCEADAATREEITEFWFNAKNAADPVGDEPDPVGSTSAAAAESVVPPGHECESCGSWVTDAARHRRWHGEYVPRTMLRVVGGTD